MGLIQRVTTEEPFNLSASFYVQDTETLFDPDTNAVTCQLVHVNGTVLLATTAATRDAQGQYHVTVPPQANPAKAIAVWKYTVSGNAAQMTRYIDIIQSHYVDLAEIRTLDGLSDTSAYPVSILAEKRDDAETLFEVATGIYWTTHYVRDILDGDPNYRVALQSAIRDVIDYIPYKRLVLHERFPQSLISISFIDPNTGTLEPFQVPTTTLTSGYSVGQATANVTSTAGQIQTPPTPNIPNFPTSGPVTIAGVQNPLQYTGTTATTLTGLTGGSSGSALTGAAVSVPLSSYYLLYASGELEAQLGVAAFPRGMENVIVDYYAGAKAMPADLTLALKRYIRYLVLNTNARVPDRATAMTTEFGTFRLGNVTPWDNPTGLPEVDAVIRRYGIRVPSFA